MPNDSPSPYWDSSVFLAYINGEPARLPIIDSLLHEIEQEESRRIYTSTISRVEVAFAAIEADSAVLDAQTLAGIDALWDDRSVVEVVELHDEIALAARGLMRGAIARGWSLKPIDAVHLATASWLDVVEFHTYDSPLQKYKDLVDFQILEPYALQGRLPNT
jgi:predicted nucleic acid-binding protein